MTNSLPYKEAAHPTGDRVILLSKQLSTLLQTVAVVPSLTSQHLPVPTWEQYDPNLIAPEATNYLQ